jgi:hypothetical protein
MLNMLFITFHFVSFTFFIHVCDVYVCVLLSQTMYTLSIYYQHNQHSKKRVIL